MLDRPHGVDITVQPPLRPQPQHEHGFELRKRSLLGDAERQRIEFGAAEIDIDGEKHKIVIAHDRGADIVDIHGVVAHLTDIRRDLRLALVSTSSAFSRAVNDEEQAGLQAAVASVIGAVLREHPDLGAKVREKLQIQRYD